MNKKIFIIFTVFILTILVLPVWALDCNRKPCHSKCIENQPTYIQKQCWCDARKKVYYHYWGTNFGVPEYNATCDGSYEQYVEKYCAAKMRYDNYNLNNYNPNIANHYTPQYDPICDKSREEYYQKLQVIRQNQAMNNMAEVLKQPVQVNVNHSGTVQQNVRLDGTIRHNNYYYY